MPSDPVKLDPSTSKRILKLRAELKEWEHVFAKAHDGRKPTRDEVKADTEINAKYREYARLRSSSSSTDTKKPSSKPSPVEQPAPPPAPTSVPTPAVNQTPTKNIPTSPWPNETYESPLSIRRQRLFGRRDQVGPTPQKTGKVLGIFESFIDVVSTPPHSSARAVAAELGTPSKSVGDERVPVSPPFSTPRKRKLAEVSGKKEKDIFATPTALREWKPHAPADDADSPRVRRPPPRPKRGLSSMLKELREMEAHALDDEEEVMREMEAAEAAGEEIPKKKENKEEPLFDEVELPPLPPGAFVEETLQDEDDGEKKGGEERKAWKKKGLKRQHRRVIMRPVIVKPTAQAAGDGEDEEDDEDDEDQPPIPAEIENAPPSDDEDDEDPKKKSKKKPKKKPDAAAAAQKGKKPAAVRKISANATSHMNFRKLNIKNKNSKGKGGGRFGKRR